MSAFTEVLPSRCDVSEFEQVEAARDCAYRRWGKVDVLVNTAALLGATGELWRTDPKAWRSAVAANLFGTYNTMRVMLKPLAGESLAGYLARVPRDRPGSP